MQEVYGTCGGRVCLSVSPGRYHSSVNIVRFYVCMAFVSRFLARRFAFVQKLWREKANSPVARKAKNFNEITRDVIPGCSGGHACT